MPESSGKSYNYEKAREEGSRMQNLIEKIGAKWFFPPEVSEETRQFINNNINHLYSGAEQIAEVGGEIVAVARIERAEVLEKSIQAGARIKQQKVDELKNRFNLEVLSPHTLGPIIVGAPKGSIVEMPGKLTYRDEKKIIEFDDPEYFFTEPTPDLAKLNKEDPALRLTWQLFQLKFSQLPKEVQKAARDYYYWVTNIKGTGQNLDACRSAGLVTKDQYQKIKQAETEGKMIIGNVVLTQPIEPMGDRGLTAGAIYFWAIAESPESSVV